MTPRRAFAFLKFGRKLQRIEKAERLYHNALAARGEERHMKAAIKELAKG